MVAPPWEVSVSRPGSHSSTFDRPDPSRKGFEALYPLGIKLPARTTVGAPLL